MSSPKTTKRTRKLHPSPPNETASAEPGQAILGRLSDVPDPAPVHIDGMTWGPWQFRAQNLTLEHAETGYWIDLEQCTTSAQVLDWLCQVSQKTWCTREAAGYLLQALAALLDPQATLCSGGQGRRLYASTYLRRKLRQASRREPRTHTRPQEAQ